MVFFLFLFSKESQPRKVNPNGVWKIIKIKQKETNLINYPNKDYNFHNKERKIYKVKLVPLGLKWNENFLSLFLLVSFLSHSLYMSQVPALLFKRRNLTQMKLKFSLNEPQIRSGEIIAVGLEYLIQWPHHASRS